MNLGVTSTYPGDLGGQAPVEAREELWPCLEERSCSDVGIGVHGDPPSTIIATRGGVEIPFESAGPGRDLTAHGFGIIDFGHCCGSSPLHQLRDIFGWIVWEDVNVMIIVHVFGIMSHKNGASSELGLHAVQNLWNKRKNGETSVELVPPSGGF